MTPTLIRPFVSQCSLIIRHPLKNVKRHSCAAVFNFNICVTERGQDLPRHSNSAQRIHAADEARYKNERREQDGQRQKHEPDQENWNPESKRAAVVIAQADYGNKRDHFRVSISRMASSAVISPRPRRSRISALDGVGLVSTKSRLPAIRVSRDLIVG